VSAAPTLARLPVLARLRGLAGTRAVAGAYPTPRLARIAGGLAAASTLISAGHVSEAGVGAHAASYRLGIIGLGVGLVLLGFALAPTLPAVTVLLAGGGGLASLSGSVPCTEGCPLPPYESPTLPDLVHAGASILGVGAVVLAMIAIAVLAADSLLRRVSRVAVCVVVPLLAIMGITMLAVGRGNLAGLLERAVLTLAAAWALTMCVRLTLSRPARLPAAPS
jgi:hypothetical protein